MNRLKMHTPNLADENYKKLAALFPNAVTEAIDPETGEVVRAIDADVLRQEISGRVVEGREERYQFTWPDKKKAMLAANAPIAATLRPVRADSVGRDGTPGGWDSENLYIEGDNLDVLKLLQETYLGRVKMIYIDPPYNTGNDFVYEDDFAEDAESYLGRSGQFDEQGNRLEQNTESNGRFHTDWLNMLYPRLRLAKNLLTEDGVIFISIDENEVAALQMICDEVFNRNNFVAQLVWAAGRKNDSKHISVSHEYILCYFRNMDYIKEHSIIWREKKQGLNDIYDAYERLKKQYGGDYIAISKGLKAWYKSLPDGHPAKDHSHYCKADRKGVYFAADISWPGGGGPKYEMLHPITHRPVKIPSRGWITNETTLRQWAAEDRIDFGPDETGVPTLKSYLKEHEMAVPYSVFYKDGRASSKRLAVLLGDKVFENPKDEEIMQRIIEFSGVDDGDIVLDFFSGSGTTAHAMFLANIAQSKKRRFILVQLPEVIDPETTGSDKAKKVAKNAVALLDSIHAPHTICEIGKERIRRAGRKIKDEAGLTAQNLDIGFRVLRLDSSNMQDVYYNPAAMTQDLLSATTDNIKPDRTPEDLLFQVMLDLGVELSSPIAETTIDGKKVFDVADGFLLACFDQGVTTETVTAIAQRKPYYAVFRDSSMADDSTATNFDQIFETYSPNTVRKVL